MTQIQLRRGTQAEWAAANPILASGEVGVELDTNKFKIGNGTENWATLVYHISVTDIPGIVSGQLEDYLPLTGGDIKGPVTIDDTGPSGISQLYVQSDDGYGYSIFDAVTRSDETYDHVAELLLYADPAETAAYLFSDDIVAMEGDRALLYSKQPIKTAVDWHGVPQRITNLADPVDPLDVVNKKSLQASSRSELLQEAVWHVDAATASSDRLLDLTGRGRDAVFGAAAAAPVVLPWTGEDYVAISPFADNYLHLDTVTLPFGTMTFDFYWPGSSPGSGGYYLVSFDNMTVQIYSGTELAIYNAGEVLGWSGVIPTAAGRHVLSVVMAPDGKTITPSLDGVSLGAKTTTAVRTVVPSGWVLSGNVSGLSTPVRLYKMNLAGAAVFDPRNVSADYTSIANTGTQTGVPFQIFRAATGYKTAVVDRPLLLFGGGQVADAGATSLGLRNQATLLMSFRDFSQQAPKGIGGIETGAPNWVALAFGTYGSMYRHLGGTAEYQSPLSGSAAKVLGASLSGSTFASYRDGVLLDRTPGASANPADWSGAGLKIGAYAKQGYNYEMEFVAAAIWDRALTDAEIAQASLDLAGVPHTKQPDPHPQYAIRSTVGNLLTANQASIETDASGWSVRGVAAGEGAATIARSTAQALHGSASLAITSGDTNAYQRIEIPPTSALPAAPGEVFTLKASLKDASGRQGSAAIIFYDANNGFLTYPEDAKSLSGGAWKQFSVTAVAPANTAKVGTIIGTVTGSTAGQVCYVDCVSIHKGAGGDWAMPGTPITGLGTQVTHPNTDDVLAQVWDSGKGQWQTVHYDSGVRNIGGLLASNIPGATAVRMYIRRVNTTVYLDGWQINSPTDSYLDLPGGFNYGYDGERYFPGFNKSAAPMQVYGYSIFKLNINPNLGTLPYISWLAPDAIPTSLPGTLVSPAPAFAI